MVALVVLLGVAVGLLGLLVAGLLRSHAEILRALHDLGVSMDPLGTDRDDPPASEQRGFVTQPGVPGPRGGDTPASDIAGVDPFGEAVSVAVLGTQHLTLLVFLSSTCLTCHGFWEALGARDLEVPKRARPVIVTRGLEAESESALRKLAPRGVTTVLSSEGWRDYRVPASPYFVLVDGSARRVVGEGAASTWVQVRNLMEQSLADAGLAADRGPGGRGSRGGSARGARIDADLRKAGIGRGDPSLFPTSPDDAEAGGA